MGYPENTGLMQGWEPDDLRESPRNKSGFRLYE
jgi:hypothetical protein